MNKEFNPFPVSGYKGADYFCDRESESGALKKNIKNNINTTIFAIRRIGKAGLIHHVFESFATSGKTACIYVDILSTRNLKEFTNLLATGIYNRFPETKSIGKKLIQIIKSLRPFISYDPLTGSPELSFELRTPKQYEITIQQLFTFLDNQNIKIVFAIDEFQQILTYPEKNVEALLRTHMQTLRNTSFIFCGSNQKMMHEIFNSAKRPFFASCSNLHLDLIKSNVYSDFIIHTFTKQKRRITRESVDFILDFTCCHTFYTQYFCNSLFAEGLKHIELEDTQKTAQEILLLNESTYYQYRNLITGAQWQLLQAIAKEEKVFKAHSRTFISKYNLGTSSLVSRGIEALLQKELIRHNTTIEIPYYQVYDKFLMRWLQSKP